MSCNPSMLNSASAHALEEGQHLNNRLSLQYTYALFFKQTNSNIYVDTRPFLHHYVHDVHRLTAAQQRDKYEGRHMGNFRRIYPAAAPPVQAKYEWLLQGSARMFASSMKAKAHNTIGRIQVGLCSLHSRSWVLPAFRKV